MAAEHQNIIAYADKTVLRIEGAAVSGLDPRELEETLSRKLNSVVRVIGVTGSSLEFDIYGIDPEKLYRDEREILQAVSLTDGITGLDVMRIARAEKIVPVSYDELDRRAKTGCSRERWTGE
jgi:hypothetical protein